MKKKWIISLASVLSVIGLISAGSLYADQEFTEEKAKVIKQEDLAEGNFELTASNKTNSKEVEVDVILQQDSPTLEDLEAYRNQMPGYFETLKNKGHDNIPVTVTMKEALSAQDFENFVQENSLEVENFEIRVMDEQGLRATLGGRPDDGDLYPEKKLNEFLDGEKTIKGVYLIKANMPVEQELFDKLHNDNRVFVADVSEKILEEKVKNSTEYKQLGDDKHIDINLPNNLYWKLEDLKIAK